MADNHSTGKHSAIKTLKDTQALYPPCQNCVIITKTMDTTALAQSGFSDLGGVISQIPTGPMAPTFIGYPQVFPDSGQ
jgi:hypothetical protein